MLISNCADGRSLLLLSCANSFCSTPKQGWSIAIVDFGKVGLNIVDSAESLLQKHWLWRWQAMLVVETRSGGSNWPNFIFCSMHPNWATEKMGNTPWRNDHFIDVNYVHGDNKGAKTKAFLSHFVCCFFLSFQQQLHIFQGLCWNKKMQQSLESRFWLCEPKGQFMPPCPDVSWSDATVIKFCSNS